VPRQWFLFLSVSTSRCLPIVLAFWIPLISDRLSGVTIIIIIKADEQAALAATLCHVALESLELFQCGSCYVFALVQLG
jgi:hypothetical protein